MDLGSTKLDYYDDMWRLQSSASLLSTSRNALILDRTIFYPQGGGQPAHTGFIRISGSYCKFVVQDVRSKDGIVFHYGLFENLGQEFENKIETGSDARRKLNSRPWVEYKGTIPQNEIQNKHKDLELEANGLISVGGKASVAILPYEEATELCGGCLSDYVPKESTPRIVRIGDTPGCPCGGTHALGFLKFAQRKD